MKKINKKFLIIGGIVVLGLAALIFKGRLGTKRVVMKNKSTGEKVVVENKGKDKCSAGSYVDSGQGRYEIIGREKHQFEGKEVELCCGQGENKNGQKTKYCYSVDDKTKDYMMIWTASNQTGGKYQKYMENYPKNGQICTRMFGKGEKVLMESCQ